MTQCEILDPQVEHDFLSDLLNMFPAPNRSSVPSVAESSWYVAVMIFFPMCLLQLFDQASGDER
jgi:hypothetical protein